MEAGPSGVVLSFRDESERELLCDEMYLAVYAAGGGKRNMVRLLCSIGCKPITIRFLFGVLALPFWSLQLVPGA